MHISSINFISFTAQIYSALHMQGKKATLASWGAWHLCSPQIRLCISHYYMQNTYVVITALQKSDFSNNFVLL